MGEKERQRVKSRAVHFGMVMFDKYSLTMFLLVLSFLISEASCQDPSCVDLSAFVQNGIGLKSSVIWNSTAHCTGHCAKLCVRLTNCRSIAYNVDTHICELSDKVVAEVGSRQEEGLEYSEFSSWPASVDEVCHSKPCSLGQSCFPRVATKSGNACPYTCIQTLAHPTCPVPTSGYLIGGRGVDGVNIVTCQDWEYGGGNATCQNDFTWSNVIPPCAPIYTSSCDISEVDCSVVIGECNADEMCVCPPDWIFNGVLHRCEEANQCPEEEGLTVPREPGNYYPITCHEGYYGEGTVRCTVALTWEYIGTRCTKIHGSVCQPSPGCTSIGGVCNPGSNICECPENFNYTDTEVMCISDPVCIPLEGPAVLYYPGDVVPVTCPNNHYGGGNLTCNADLTWQNNTTPCTPFYDSACEPPVDCTSIAGVCDPGSNICLCPANFTYNSTIFMCLPVPVCVPLEGSPVSHYPGDAVPVTCPTNHYGGGNLTCNADLTWQNNTTPCTPIYRSVCNAGVDCTSINGECDPNSNICECPFNYFYDNTVYLCVEVQLRLSQGRDASTGYVQIFMDGFWANVVDNGWTWPDTNVTCQQVNDSWIFGGSFHEKYMDKSSLIIESRDFDLDCTGNETSILECESGTMDTGADPGKTIAVTCIKSPNIDDVYLQANPTANLSIPDLTAMSGLLIVIYDGIPVTLCGEGWRGTETDIACKSINSTWMGDDECFGDCLGFTNDFNYVNNLPVMADRFKCTGSEPHIKQCQNEGWWEIADCNKVVKIQCR